jgi:hypothetical protein
MRVLLAAIIASLSGGLAAAICCQTMRTFAELNNTVGRSSCRDCQIRESPEPRPSPTGQVKSEPVWYPGVVPGDSTCNEVHLHLWCKPVKCGLFFHCGETMEKHSRGYGVGYGCRDEQTWLGQECTITGLPWFFSGNSNYLTWLYAGECRCQCWQGRTALVC